MEIGNYSMPYGFDKFAAAAVVAALILVAGTRAQAQTPSSAPVCIYQSESYSEGAFLCIRKGLMLGCTASAGKVNWTVSTDRELSNLCGSSDYRARLAPRQRYAQRRRPIEAAAVTAPAPASPAAKCFVFNGKSYCE
jgi:hypothetical protein